MGEDVDFLNDDTGKCIQDTEKDNRSNLVVMRKRFSSYEENLKPAQR